MSSPDHEHQRPRVAGQVLLSEYGRYVFGTLGAATIGIGVVMLLISRPVHRGMRGVD